MDMSRCLRGFAAVAVAAAAISFSASAVARTVDADLSGYEEVPSVSTAGEGRFRAKIDEKAGTIYWKLQYSGMQADVSQAHIHLGQRHTNGGITVFLCTNLGNGPAGTQPCPAREANLDGMIMSADVLATPPAQQLPVGGFEQLVNAIRAGATYVNVHTAVSPAGEIRGQIDGKGHDRH
jgi:hypothetical protein